MVSAYTILYKPTFLRSFKKLYPDLQDEVEEVITRLAHRKNHKTLRVHKLTGRLGGCWSCSVNYQYRIIFAYERKDAVVLLDVGDHDVYR